MTSQDRIVSRTFKVSEADKALIFREPESEYKYISNPTGKEKGYPNFMDWLDKIPLLYILIFGLGFGLGVLVTGIVMGGLK